MLYLIGIGLGNEKDITLNGIEALKKSDYIYLENYTSNIGFEIENLEKLISKKIILVNRKKMEEEINSILDQAKEKIVSVLIKGDIFSATTHITILLSAKEKNIDLKIIHNASILNVIGDTGLMLYNFGKTASIPFNNEQIETPYNVLNDNLSIGLHTLFLLDLKSSFEFMNFKEGINYIIKIENKQRLNLINNDSKVIICAGLGTKKQIIKYGKIKDLLKSEIEIYPQCFIIPGKLHFIEEEVLKLFN